MKTTTLKHFELSAHMAAFIVVRQWQVAIKNYSALPDLFRRYCEFIGSKN